MFNDPSYFASTSRTSNFASTSQPYSSLYSRRPYSAVPDTVTPVYPSPDEAPGPRWSSTTGLPESQTGSSAPQANDEPLSTDLPQTAYDGDADVHLSAQAGSRFKRLLNFASWLVCWIWWIVSLVVYGSPLTSRGNRTDYDDSAAAPALGTNNGSGSDGGSGSYSDDDEEEAMNALLEEMFRRDGELKEPGLGDEGRTSIVSGVWAVYSVCSLALDIIVGRK